MRLNIPAGPAGIATSFDAKPFDSNKFEIVVLTYCLKIRHETQQGHMFNL